jgi:hypothetical protein
MVWRSLQLVRATLAYSLIALLIAVPAVQAQSQVVHPSELKSAIEKASASRKKNLDQVRSFFSSKPVTQALSRTAITSDRIDRAVSTLTPDDLAKLAQRTQKIQSDFAAGALTNQELTYVVIALATAVVILVIVAAD